jgi:hypothetical protein
MAVPMLAVLMLVVRRGLRRSGGVHAAIVAFPVVGRFSALRNGSRLRVGAKVCRVRGRLAFREVCAEL